MRGQHLLALAVLTALPVASALTVVDTDTFVAAGDIHGEYTATDPGLLPGPEPLIVSLQFNQDNDSLGCPRTGSVGVSSPDGIVTFTTRPQLQEPVFGNNGFVLVYEGTGVDGLENRTAFRIGDQRYLGTSHLTFDPPLEHSIHAGLGAVNATWILEGTSQNGYEFTFAGEGRMALGDHSVQAVSCGLFPGPFQL